jgi:hypothetical protein
VENGRRMEDDFLELSAKTARDDSPEQTASARLKSNVYSALINHMEASGPLLPVGETEATHGLCVFEKLVEITPLPGTLQTFNACSICHARVLAERLEHPPIYWKNCPYVSFKHG